MRAMWLHYPDDERARGLGTQFLWGRDLLSRRSSPKGATIARCLSAEGRVVRLVDECASTPGGQHRESASRSGDDADLRPRRSDHPSRSGSAIHGRAGQGTDDTARLSRRRWSVHALRGRRHQPGVPEGPRILDANAWNDARSSSRSSPVRRAARRTSPTRARSRFSCCPKVRCKESPTPAAGCR